ncbi:MAG: hypothetical protein WA510_12250 [Acidobacteriaceae bacterium]
MQRRQLFEILDQAWCPTAIRHGATDILEAIISRSNIYRPVQAKIFRAITDCGAERVIDLCSGGGGPWLSPPWRAALAQHSPLNVILSDKFPNQELWARLPGDSLIRSVDLSVDAAHVPEFLRGFRTIFSSFHHFGDATACEVLGDAVRSGDGFAMAEVTSRTVRAFAIMLVMPVLVWILTPRVRPLRWSRLLLTYVLPLIPMVVLFDGVVSCFRTRTPQELLALTRGFPQYEWTAGYAPGGWLSPVFLIGGPRPADRSEITTIKSQGGNCGLDE